MVRFAQVNLRSHVSLGAELRSQVAILVSACSWSCESKISDLEVELFVKHDVLRLQISVANTVLVHVLKRLTQLCEVEPCEFGLKLATVRYKVEHLSSLGELQHNVVDLL